MTLPLRPALPSTIPPPLSSAPRFSPAPRWIRAGVLVLMSATVLGCADDERLEHDNAGSSGGGSEVDLDDSTAEAPEGRAETYIRGTFVEFDGDRYAFEADRPEYNEPSTEDERPSASCLGNDLDGHGLSISFPAAMTEVGTYALETPRDLYLLASWTTLDRGYRTQLTRTGTVTITEYGTEPGDAVAGSAYIELLEDDGDPDNRYGSVEDIEFRCVVPPL